MTIHEERERECVYLLSVAEIKVIVNVARNIVLYLQYYIVIIVSNILYFPIATMVQFGIEILCFNLLENDVF